MYATKIVLLLCAFSVLIDKSEGLQLWTSIKEFFTKLFSRFRKTPVNVHDVTSEEQFQTLINNAFDKNKNKNAENQLVVVDLYATWCEPCRKLAPLLVDLAKKYPEVIFIKAKPEQDELNLSDEWQTTSYPTIKFLTKGKVKDTMTSPTIDLIEKKIVELQQSKSP